MILGPFIAHHREIDPETFPGFPYTGYCFQVAEGDDLLEIPIYYDEDQYFPGRKEYSDFFLNVEDVPFSFYYSPGYHLKHLGAGETLIRFEPVFIGLCHHFGVNPIESLQLLRDAASSLKINSTLLHREPLLPAKGLLHPRVEQLGFVLNKPYSYERILQIDLNFRIRKLEDGKDLEIRAYQWQVRPTADGKLGKLAFRRPNLEESYHLDDLFLHALMAEGITPENLLTPAGEFALIANYEWTKLARMTNAEAKKERLLLIAKHPELWDDLGSLADLLISHELYSPNTSRSQIIKFLPRQISEARKSY